jgi:hypothetical protein
VDLVKPIALTESFYERFQCLPLPCFWLVRHVERDIFYRLPLVDKDDLAYIAHIKEQVQSRPGKISK